MTSVNSLPQLGNWWTIEDRPCYIIMVNMSTWKQACGYFSPVFISIYAMQVLLIILFTCRQILTVRPFVLACNTFPSFHENTKQNKSSNVEKCLLTWAILQLFMLMFFSTVRCQRYALYDVSIYCLCGAKVARWTSVSHVHFSPLRPNLRFSASHYELVNVHFAQLLSYTEAQDFIPRCSPCYNKMYTGILVILAIY